MSVFFAILGKLKSINKLPYREKLWLLFLYPYSGLIRVTILLLPFKVYSKYLGFHHKNITFSTLASIEETRISKRIGQIVEVTSNYTPWQSQCLVQAIMAKTLFSFYNIDYVIHLGAKTTNEPKEPIKAHAWTIVGCNVVTGKAGHKTYGILSTYSSIHS